MTAEAGHHTGRSYMARDGSFHMNGAAFWNDAEEDISASLEVLNSLAPAELTFLDGAVAGTLTASKCIVADASSQIDALDVTGTLTATGKVTAAALTLESLNPMTVKLNDVDALQFDNAAISAFAAAADTAGNAVYIETEDGGVDTAVDGGSAGGALSLKCGDGSAGGADFDGAAGGAVTIAAGAGSAGGAHTANDPDGGNGGTVTITPGTGGAAGAAGSGVAGDPGKVKLGAGLLHFTNAQTIDMADAQVALTLNPGTPAGTTITSNVLYVDANSGANENLLLPPEADANGLQLTIVNTGGETINIQNDAAGAVLTLETANTALVVCDGTTWRGIVGVP